MIVFATATFLRSAQCSAKKQSGKANTRALERLSKVLDGQGFGYHCFRVNGLFSRCVCFVGVVWCGVVWHGVARCDVGWHCVAWRGVALHGAEWRGMARHDRLVQGQYQDVVMQVCSLCT